MIIPFKSIPNVEQAFRAVPDDKRLAKLFSYNETLDLCRIVEAESPKRRIREYHLIGAIRERLYSGEFLPPACNCGVGEGRRWHASDRGESVSYGIHPSVQFMPFDVAPFIHESMEFVANLGQRLEFKPLDKGVPDIIIEAAPYDGPGRTLGVTMFYLTEDLDLHVGGGEPSVRLLMDTGERWTIDYFRTVFRHEALHAVGLEHSDDYSDLMYELYTGIHLGHPGVWTQNQIDQRYTQRIIRR